jgi:hypothetical protein
MPTNKRKGRRGKQRKDDADLKAKLKDAETEGTAIWKMIRDLKTDGFRCFFKDDGAFVALHPRARPDLTADEVSNRALWDEEEKVSVVNNYIHNFAQEVRDGDFEGTKVIAGNLSCPHLGSKLSEALFKEDIHIAMLDFLGKCDGHLSVALKGAVGERANIPSLWMDILTFMVDYECPHETLLILMVATRLEALVMCMIHDRRLLFRSNNCWHMSLPSFFDLMYNLMCQSEEAREIIISYDGFLPFVARASCYDVTHRDVARPKSFATASSKAQRLTCLVVEEHDFEEEGDADVKNDPLELIACTPLSNDAGCKDSTMVGFVRSMRHEKEDHHSSYLSVIIETLLWTGDYVDKRVIAELIEYGRGDSSSDSAEYAMYLMLGILGVEDSEIVRPSDSRYAAAISCGFLEFCDHAASSIKRELSIAPLKYFFETLSSMALHSKTSRVLASGKLAQIHLALETLDKHHGHGIVLPALDNFDDHGTFTCCNCLKKFEKKKLRLCNCCKIEQYCSLSCQEESWYAGHSRLCKKVANDCDNLRSQGVSEADIKRLTILKSNLMARGCSFVQSNIEFLKSMLSDVENVEAGDSITILVDFGEVPQTIETVVRPSNSEGYIGSLHFEFVSPVWYGFAEWLGWDSVRLDKYINIYL